MPTTTEGADAPVYMTMRAFDRDTGDDASARANALVACLEHATHDGEHVSAYVAPPELQALRGDNPDPRFAAGHGTWLTIAHGAATTDDAPGREGEGLLGRFVSTWAFGADAQPVAAASLLEQDHVGIQVAYGLVADHAWRATIGAWYRDIHAPDVIGVDGVIGCVRFVSRDQSEPCAGEHLVIFLLDDDPATVMARVRGQVPAWRDAGRTPSPGRASRAVFNGPSLRVGGR